MNLKDFSANLTTHRKKSQFGKKHDILKRDEEDFLQTNRHMSMRIFDGKADLTFDEYWATRDKI